MYSSTLQNSSCQPGSGGSTRDPSSCKSCMETIIASESQYYTAGNYLESMSLLEMGFRNPFQISKLLIVQSASFPLLEAEGDCRLVTDDTAQVECNDPRLGSYLSPTLFQASNGDDLFDWWLQTSPPPSSSSVEEEEVAAARAQAVDEL